jgi:NarL family two-component system response regulator LiaR
VIVDDHEIVREGLASVLSLETDVEVVGEASNGKAALRLVRTLQPDVVLMDVLMPETDGIETTRRIRSELNPPAIIGLTAALDKQTDSEMRRAGAEVVLAKSASVKKILAAIRSSGVQQDSSSSEPIQK